VYTAVDLLFCSTFVRSVLENTTILQHPLYGTIGTQQRGGLTAKTGQLSIESYSY
jgi:hypothetical protein